MGLDAARMRMTMSSLEFTVGSVATRNSMVRSRILNLILPSWGLRLSEISSLAMILNLATSGLRNIAGTSWYFTQSPSMRKRMRVFSSLP